MGGRRERRLARIPDRLTYWNGGYTSARFSSASLLDAGAGHIAPPGVRRQIRRLAIHRNGRFLDGCTDKALTSVGPDRIGG